MSRYDPLTTYLETQPAVRVHMTFADIEHVLGRKLPASAGTHRGWWSNNASNNVMTRAWLDAGFRSEKVDLAGRTLVFRRTAGTGFAEASQPSIGEAQACADKLALFGWMKGTITLAPGTDLTEPADPDLPDLVVEFDEPAA